MSDAGKTPPKRPLCEKFLVIQELEKNKPRAEVAKIFDIELSEVSSIWNERGKAQYKWLADASQSWHDDPERDKSVQVDINMLRRQTKIWIKDMQLGKKNPAKVCYQRKRKLHEVSLPRPSKKAKTVGSNEEKSSFMETSDIDLSCAACLPDEYQTSCKWDVRDRLRWNQRLAIIDDALLNWFNKIKRTRDCINYARLDEKVKEFVKFLNYASFHPSNSWFKIWRKRHKIPIVVSGPTTKFGLFHGQIKVNSKTDADVSRERKNVSYETLKDRSSISISKDCDPIGKSSVTANLESTDRDWIPLQENLEIHNFRTKREGEQNISDIDRVLLAWYNDVTYVGQAVSSETLLEMAHYFAKILCYENFEPPADFPSCWKKKFGLLENTSNPTESEGENQNEVILSQSDDEIKKKVGDIAKEFKIHRSDLARIVKRQEKAQKTVKDLKMTSLDYCNLVLKELYKKKKTHSEIALSHEISESTVAGIWEHRFKLLAADKIDNLDACLLSWYYKCQRGQADVDDDAILEKSQYFAKRLKKTHLNLSKVWVKRWRMRCGLRARKKNHPNKVNVKTGNNFEPPAKRIKVSPRSLTDENSEDFTDHTSHQFRENVVCSKADQEMVGKNSTLRRDVVTDTAEVLASQNITENRRMEVPQRKDDVSANLHSSNTTSCDFDEENPKVVDPDASNVLPSNEKVLEALCTISQRLAAEGIDMINFLKLEEQVLDNMLTNAGVQADFN